MIWLTWRQHRRQALFTLIGVAALAALMIPTGLAMRHAFTKAGLPACINAIGDQALVPNAGERCGPAFTQFNSQFHTFVTIGVLFLFLPLLVGLFWGAPLVAREVEQGTHRLVWTQGISRRHWAVVKFGLVGGVAVVVAIAYGLGMSWWLGPLSQAGQNSRFNPFLFDMQGIVPIGYTLFAVALGVFAGTVWHKVLPAMAVTLVGFVGVRIVLAVLARPHYLAARTLTYPLQNVTLEPNSFRGDWVLDLGIRDVNGRMLAPNVQVACPPNPTGPGAADCGTGLGAGIGSYNWQLYQPAVRFWMFQGIETGIFLVLTALLIYLAMRRIRRIA